MPTAHRRLAAALAIVAATLTVGAVADQGRATAQATTAWDLEATASYSTFPAVAWGQDIRAIVTVNSPGSALTHAGFVAAYNRYGNPPGWHWGAMHAINGQPGLDSSLDGRTAITQGASYRLRLHLEQRGTGVDITFYVDGQQAKTVTVVATVLMAPGTVVLNQAIGIYPPANVSGLSSLAVHPS